MDETLVSSIFKEGDAALSRQLTRKQFPYYLYRSYSLPLALASAISSADGGVGGSQFQSILNST
ncbi:hypothetical protein IMCC3135_30675 [Granulosicoccus antarcticus IMCC3135]|uniref:Uncharacterized protein n=1 Tax=Granulosicoccus antarcticus IMCC3135 TaxID=1192854 RepID=A0A2Z2P8J2_9GAMM|nr:hypothetical protein IMCC3135_30675 [Granulosicoccus antarcticus IMCC3135]